MREGEGLNPCNAAMCMQEGRQHSECARGCGRRGWIRLAEGHVARG